ncbi:phage tail protein, partial [Micromonospora sp. NPDC047465]|uniref:phage tail protein n=1 Tax=Micromonospora sp. NPDC047465 TaxID=3154813 RepID=UPI0033F0201D
NADIAADAIKEFGIKAIDGSKGARDAYKLLGMDADAMIAKIAKGGPSAAQGFDAVLDGLRKIEDPVKQNTVGVGLFGTKWEDMRDALLTMDLDTAAQQMSGLEGATQKAADTVGQTAGAKLDEFKRKAQQALIDKLAEAVPYIEKTFGWLSKNSGWVTPLATGLGILAVVIGTIIGVMKVWAAVQTVLNLALWTSPITWIVLGVLLLVAAVYLIATKTTWFQAIWEAVWGAIKAAFWFVVNWIINGWKWAIGLVVAGVKLWWSIFTGFWGWVGKKAADTWKWITDGFGKLVSFVKGLPGRISKAASGMWNGIKSSFKAAVNWLIGKWNNFSLTIGGGSVLGMDIPSVTLSTPDIPYLADGGIVPATPGGRLAVIGEGGHDEAVVPLPRGARDFAAGGGRGPTVIEVQAADRRVGELLIELLRPAIQGKGGDVQFVLGPRRRHG